MIKINKNIKACLAGNVIEWYEFALFIYLSSSVAKSIGYAGNDKNSWINLILVYSVGFLFRPIGAIVIGYIGDMYGRKKALLYSVLMMSLGSTLLALIPSSEVVGGFAFFLFFLCRAMQGLSGGGEFTTSLVYLGEEASDKTRKLMSSLSYASAQFGLLLGAVIGSLLSYAISTGVFPLWSWRVGFFLCLPASILCYVLRKSVIDDNARSVEKRVSPIKHYRTVFSGYKKGLFSVFGINAFAQTIFYAFSFCVINWSLSQSESFEQAMSLVGLNSFLLLVIIVIIPLASLVYSTKMSTKSLKYFFIAIVPVLFVLLNSRIIGGESASLFLAFAGACIIAFILAPLPNLYHNLFPYEVRSSAVALPFNTSAAIFGGLSPVIIIHYISTGDIFPVGIYLSVLCVFAIISLYLVVNERKLQSKIL